MPARCSSIGTEPLTRLIVYRLADRRGRWRRVQRECILALLLVVVPSGAMAQDWWLFHRLEGCMRAPLVEGERLVPDAVIKRFPKCFIDSGDTYGKGPWTFVNCFAEKAVGQGLFYFREQRHCRAFAARAAQMMRQRR